MSKILITSDADHVAKEIALRAWVNQHLGTTRHEARVAQLANRFFRLTSRWHALGKTYEKLLTLSALVHDVGRAECDDGHAKAGARMILENAALPLDPAERRKLAFLTRYHRGHVPDPGDENYLDHASDNLHALRTTLGLLRAADALDSRSLDHPQILATVRGKTLTILGHSPNLPAIAASLGNPKKFKLLESTLGCQVKTKWFSTTRLAQVS